MVYSSPILYWLSIMLLNFLSESRFPSFFVKKKIIRPVKCEASVSIFNVWFSQNSLQPPFYNDSVCYCLTFCHKTEIFFFFVGKHYQLRKMCTEDPLSIFQLCFFWKWSTTFILYWLGKLLLNFSVIKQRFTTF